MPDKNITILIEKYTEAVQSGKSIYLDADEFVDLAEYYDSLEDPETAREVIVYGLGIHPDNTSLLIRKAKFEVFDGEYLQGLNILNSISGEYDFDLYLLKIECYLQLDQYDDANLLTEELIAKEDSEEPYHVFAELGFLYIEAEYFDESISLFRKSLKTNPENIDVLSDLAYSYEMIEDYESAIETTNKILDIEPYTYEAWINLGKLHSLTEDFEKAIDAFDFAFTINDSDKTILKLKAHCMSLSDRTEEAIDIFNELLLADQEDFSLYFLLAECYQARNMYDEALKNLNRYEELAGETIELIEKKAFLLLQKEDYQKAEDLINKNLLIYPDSSDLNIVAGEIAFKQENFNEAKYYYSKIYPQNDNNFHLVDRLAILSIKEEDFEKAVFYTEKLLKISPENLAIRERLALLYFELDDNVRFNEILGQFTDEELLSLFRLIYSPQSVHFDRNMLITYLNKARETRTLFKNLKY